MEITSGAQEVLTRAEMFRESRNADSLCTEDLLHGLLWLAVHGADEEGCGAESASVRELLRGSFADLRAALDRLEGLSAAAAGFTPADTVLGRAAELCGGEELNSDALCRAVMESPDAVIWELCAYRPAQTSAKVSDTGGNLIMADFKFTADMRGDVSELLNDLDAASGVTGADVLSGSISGNISTSESSDDAVMNELLRLIASQKGSGSDRDEEERKRREREERERKEREKQEQSGSSGQDRFEDELLRLIQSGGQQNGSEDRERKEREERERKEREERERREREERERRERERNRKRRTKLGLFTYRGGKVAAFLQYLLFGVIVPFALLVLLEIVMGLASRLTDSTLGCTVLVILWGWYLLRGLFRLIGLGNPALGHFLNTLQDVVTVRILENTVADCAFAGIAPLWLRAVGCAGILLALYVGVRGFDRCDDEGDKIVTTLLGSSRRGTFSKLILQYAVSLLLPVAAVYSVVYIFALTLPAWLIKTFWIIGFFTAWIFFFNFYDCLGLRAELPGRKYTSRKGLIKFLENTHIGLTITELALLICRLFGHFPPRLWLQIVLGVWTVVVLIASGNAAKNDD